MIHLDPLYQPIQPPKFEGQGGGPVPIPDGEPVWLLRASDPAFIELLVHYRDTLVREDGSPTRFDQINRHLALARHWAEHHDAAEETLAALRESEQLHLGDVRSLMARAGFRAFEEAATDNSESFDPSKLRWLAWSFFLLWDMRPRDTLTKDLAFRAGLACYYLASFLDATGAGHF